MVSVSNEKDERADEIRPGNSRSGIDRTHTSYQLPFWDASLLAAANDAPLMYVTQQRGEFGIGASRTKAQHTLTQAA